MSALHVETFVAFFAVALALSIAAERVGIPAPVLLVVAGALMHASLGAVPGFDFGPAVLFIFLPPLIFEAAWSIHIQPILKHLGRVFYLAIPGTIFSAAVIGYVVSLTHTLSLAGSAVFGTVISATDTAAVVSVFKRVRIPKLMKSIIEAESLANDGMATVLYTVALSFAAGAAAITIGGETSHAITWTSLLELIIVEMGGGLFVGVLFAVPIWLALKSRQSSEYETAMTVVLAYVSYLGAERLHGSGIIATAASAVMLRGLLRSQATVVHRDDINVFWNASATLVNTFVFFVTGLLIDPKMLLDQPMLIFAAITAMLAARGILALTAARTVRSRVIIFLSGIRGALPLALILSLPPTMPERELLISAVAASVLFTLIINGLPLEPAINAVYGDKFHHPHDHWSNGEEIAAFTHGHKTDHAAPAHTHLLSHQTGYEHGHGHDSHRNDAHHAEGHDSAGQRAAGHHPDGHRAPGHRPPAHDQHKWHMQASHHAWHSQPAQLPPDPDDRPGPTGA